MNRRTVITAIGLIGSTIVITSLFWNLGQSDIFRPKYDVQLRYQGNINNVRYISAVFTQGNKTKGSLIVSGDARWYNTSLPQGTYTLKLYNSETGIYLRKKDIHISTNIKLQISPTRIG